MAEKFDWDKHSRAAYDAYMGRDYRLAIRLLFPHIERFGANDERLGYAYWLIGLSLKMLEKYLEAPFYFLRAARIYSRLKKSLALDSLWWIAFCYAMQNHFRKAARYYLQVAELSLVLDLSNRQWSCAAFTQAGHCYWRSSEFELAHEAFERALQVAAGMHQCFALFAEHPIMPVRLCLVDHSLGHKRNEVPSPKRGTSFLRLNPGVSWLFVSRQVLVGLLVLLRPMHLN
jgi:tetratricopeptide (TPR) repeat protein